MKFRLNEAAVTTGVDALVEPEDPPLELELVEPQAAIAIAAPATTSDARENDDIRTDNPLVVAGTVPRASAMVRRRV